jgi:integrase
MANLKVTLLRYVKTDGGWRRVRVEPIRKGRGWDEKLHAKDKIHEVGTYQLCWYIGSRDIYKGVGDNLAEALIARDKQMTDLEAERAACAAGRTLVPEDPGRKHLGKERDEFTHLKELAGRDGETVSAYEQLIDEFLGVCKKTYADQVEGRDLLEFCHALRKRGLAERTVMNYYGSICTFLRHCGIDHKTLMPKENRPHKEDPDPEAYDDKEVKKFFEAITNERDRMFFSFLLKTGTREKEATHLEWSDLNFEQHKVVIAGEKRLTVVVDGQVKEVIFKTKTRRSRTVPLEQTLMEELKEWRKKNPSTRFVFGTSSDLPNGHYLETCKEIAAKAKLACGTCDPCLREKGCERYFLHRFRATFATWSLQRGVDIRTVQAWLGHTKIEMTARYLDHAKGKAAQDKLNAVFA